MIVCVGRLIVMVEICRHPLGREEQIVQTGVEAGSGGQDFLSMDTDDGLKELKRVLNEAFADHRVVHGLGAQVLRVAILYRMDGTYLGIWDLDAVHLRILQNVLPKGEGIVIVSAYRADDMAQRVARPICADMDSDLIGQFAVIMVLRGQVNAVYPEEQGIAKRFFYDRELKLQFVSRDELRKLLS